jgi:UrcA family protein
MNATSRYQLKPRTPAFAPWTAALTTLLATAAAAAPSQPSTPPVLDRRVAAVSLADLDVSTPQGARAARERLHETARRLCAQLEDGQDLGHQPRFVACVERALDTALRSMSGPLHAHDAQAISPGNTASVSASPVSSAGSRSLRISVADLDLSTPAGTQVARDRIHAAARRLCSQLGNMDDLGHQPQFVACVERTTAEAWQRLQGPAVAAVNGGRSVQHATP